MTTLRYLIMVLSITSPTLALDFSIPSNWREPSTTLAFADRVNLAQAAISEINAKGGYNASIGQYDVGFWPSANIFSSLALQDHYAGTTTNRAMVTSSISTVFSLYPNADQFGFNDDSLWWGTAAFYAFQAYGDQNMLDLAISNWNGISKYQITAAQAQAGSTPVKSFAIQSECAGKTMAGGVFWRPTIDDQNLNSITTDLFMTLSAYLAIQTGNATYRAAAELAATWVFAHTFNSSTSSFLVDDGISPTTCAITTMDWTYNSGKFIEGLSVLADLTGNANYATWQQENIQGATKLAPWTGSDGIITEGQEAPQSQNSDDRGFKAILIRSLGIAHGRATNSGNTALLSLIQAYIDVQYNALQQLAKSGNDYAGFWHGPFEQFYTYAQMTAIDVLVAAVAVNPR